MSNWASTRVGKRNSSKSRYPQTRGNPKRRSDSSRLHSLLQLQQTLGNRAVGRLVQAKLKVGQPGYRYEQEADHVAEQVMGMWEPAIGPGASSRSGQPPTVQRLCTECEEEMQRQPSEEEKKKDEQLQMRTEVSQRPTVPNLQARVTALQSGGRPIPPLERAVFEPRFGRDFSQVRINTDAQAAETARSINARAFTVGRSIAFGAGGYAPETIAGRKLLAHELTHVVQQTGEASGARPLVQRQPEGGKEGNKEEKLAAKIVGCSANQQSMIETGIRQAMSLAARAITALERYIPLSYEQKAMDAHFGSLTSSQQATIIERYKDIRDNVAGKTYTCAKKGKKVKEGNTQVDLCGEAYCPGSQIKLFPDFGKTACPAGMTVLHEAAHNAGACADIDKGKGYPPAKAETNAYSYEYFASAVAAGYKEPELPTHRPKAPKVSE